MLLKEILKLPLKKRGIELGKAILEANVEGKKMMKTKDFLNLKESAIYREKLLKEGNDFKYGNKTLSFEIRRGLK